MNRFHCFWATLVVVTVFAPLHATVHAQEIFKWTDANGKVHYGDRSAATERSTKIKVTVAAPAYSATASVPNLQQRSPLLSDANLPKRSVPVNPARVGPACRGLIEKIAAVPAGKNWEALYQQFDTACPGIAYECVEYESSPQKNQCTWLERSGTRVLNRKKYP